MLTEEESREHINKYLSDTAIVKSVTYFKNHWIFAIFDPDDMFDNFYSVDAKTGKVGRFNPAFDYAAEYFKAAKEQNK